MVVTNDTSDDLLALCLDQLTEPDGEIATEPFNSTESPHDNLDDMLCELVD
jgi:hypothetical protein